MAYPEVAVQLLTSNLKADLMHSRYKGLKHYILMTPEELERYGKRLYSLYERDFTVKFIEA
jgi:hypothetical protein